MQIDSSAFKTLIGNAKLWSWLKITLALALMGFILAQSTFDDFITLWQRVSVPWLLIGCLTFGGITWLHAFRYWILIGRQVGLSQVFGVVVVQTAISNLIATSAGAVSYVAMLRGAHQVALSRGITSLLLARVGDLFAVWLGLALASWIAWERITSLHWLVLLLLIAIAGGLATFLLTITLRYQFLGAMKRLLQILRMSEVPIITRVLAILATLADQDSQRLFTLLVATVIYSCALFIVTVSWIYIIVLAFAIQIDIWAVVFMSALTQLLAIVPIQVLGGLGLSDVTSMYLYGLFGIGRPEIVPFIVGSRIIFYVMNLVLLLYLPLKAHFGSNSKNE